MTSPEADDPTLTAGRRSYGQFCAIARALDRLGGRWTLLIVRDLLIAPKRFNDLLRSLPGIGTNLLSDRLRALVEEGIVEHTRLPPPARVWVYRLTPEGRDLEPVLVALAKYGQRHMADDGGDVVSPEWVLISLRTRFRPEASAGVNEAYEIRIGDDIMHLHVANERVVTAPGSADAPALVINMDEEALVALGVGRVSLLDAAAKGILTVDGTTEALFRFARLFAIP